MSKFTDRTRNIDFRINRSDWFVYINNPSSTASKITMSVSSAVANIIFKGKPFTSAKNNSEPPIKNRITMVGNKSRSLQWPIINSASCTGSHTDRCPNKGFGATCNGISTRGMWSSQEIKYHINILELLAVKLAIQTFTKYRDVKAILLKVDNIVALTYLIKMGGTQNLKMVELTKRIWGNLLKWGITITTENLPSGLNLIADWESRNILDSSELMLSHQIFQKVCQIRGFPEIDLFASRLSHQIPT